MQAVHDQGSCLLKYQIENWKKEIGKKGKFFFSFSFFNVLLLAAKHSGQDQGE